MDKEIELRQLVLEMEDTINMIIPNANFKYPEDYLYYDMLFDYIEWDYPKGKPFIQGSLVHLRDSFGIEDLVPFATNGEKGEEGKYACFLIDEPNNSKIVTIHPFGTMETICRQEYDNEWDWFAMEMTFKNVKRDMKVNGKAECVGLDLIDGAPGPVVAIPKQLLEKNKLVMTTDEGIWYADDIKDTVEKCGCGLRVLSICEMEDEDVEVVMEGITGDTKNYFCVNGEKITPPDDIYILATPFAGEYFVKLEAQDADGNRVFLWADDFIYK